MFVEMSAANPFVHKEMLVVMGAMRYNFSKQPEGSLSLPLLFLRESARGVVPFSTSVLKEISIRSFIINL